jgi:biotin carboxyl carrier protein
VEADEGDPWAGGWRLNAAPSLRLVHGDEERAVEPLPGLPVARRGDTAFVDVEGQSLEFRLAPPPAVEEAVRHAARVEGTAVLVAPMPGRVIAVRRRAGEAVNAHEAIVVLEAMKMEHTIAAPLAGTVTALHVAAGDQVQRGDVLAEVSA